MKLKLSLNSILFLVFAFTVLNVVAYYISVYGIPKN